MSFVNSLCLFSVAACLSLSSVALAGPTVGDASFEDASISGYYQYQPGGSAWTFSPGAGAAAQNQPGFAPWFTATPPDGSQAAFLQNEAMISQTINGFTVGNSYNVSFYVTARPNYTVNPVTVSMDGLDIGTVTPTSTGSFDQYTSATFTATAASETLAFAASGNPPSTDADTALDLVSINDVTSTVSATPEPGNLAYLSPVLLGAAAWLRRRNQKA